MGRKKNREDERVKKSFFRKHKKLMIMIIIIVVIVSAISYLSARTAIEKSRAYVVRVSKLNQGGSTKNVLSDGIITDGASQKFVADSGSKIVEVYVKKGDEVDNGSSLFSYDTEALSLELQSAEASRDAAKASLDSANRKLKRYEAIVPVVKTETENDNANAFDGGDETGRAGEDNEKQISDSVDSGRDDEESADPMSSGSANERTDSAMTDDGKTFANSNDSHEANANSFTQAEKDQMIANQKVVISKAETALKSAEAEVTDAKAKMDSAVVKSNMKGVVTKVGDKDNLPNDGSAFIEVSSTGTVSVKGGLSEFNIDKVKKGMKVNVTDNMTGAESTAEVTEVRDYPEADTGDIYSYSENPVSSTYSFSAALDKSKGFKTGDNVTIYSGDGKENKKAVLIDSIYVRTGKDGRKYVYLEREGRLKKKYVTAEEVTMDGMTLTSVSGLKKSDRIAFPYGKNAYSGNRTTRKKPGGLLGRMGL